MCDKRQRISNDEYISQRRTEIESLPWINKILNFKPFHFHLYFTLYVHNGSLRSTFPLRLSYRWQEDQHCLQSLCQYTAPIALISVTQHPGCSTIQPAGYWTCEAFPCSEDLSHKQSLKTAQDWLALGVIDCLNQSHKNDYIGSWVGESINYRAMPADLNISSPISTSLIPKPHQGICDSCVTNLFCGWDISATHLHKSTFSREGLFVPVKKKVEHNIICHLPSYAHYTCTHGSRNNFSLYDLKWEHNRGWC